MSQTIQLRGDTAANWTSINPVLAQRELAVETDTMKYKIGNGSSNWNALPYAQLTGDFNSSLNLTAINNPSAPAANTLAIYAHAVANRILPKFTGPSGLDNLIQSEIASNGIAAAFPGTTTALSYIGMGAMTVVGTMAHPPVTPGVNLRLGIRRANVTSAGTANSASELRNPLAMCYRGEVFGSANSGGFYMKTRFGIGTAVANQRLAVGLFNTTSAIATTQAPPGLTNAIFVGWDGADANLHIMHNDASGTCTKINLWGGFPANSTDALYELTLFSKPNGDDVGYRVVRSDTGNTVSGTITTDLPTKTTTLTYHAYMNNGGTASAVVLDFMRFYLETDY